MAISVDRVRRGLLAAAVLLVLVIGGFLGYARYRLRHTVAGLVSRLPRLGVQVRRETDGYTFSKSENNKTVMTLHAAKAVEFADGRITLHDVQMVLFGRKQDRQDRISGAEFEYEQATGVVRAVGEVHIDLQAPTSQGHATEEVEGGRVIHVKTSGLVYLQSLGVAATDQPLEFQAGGITGHAVGAEYNSDAGTLTLQAAVSANGVQRGRSMAILAGHAEFERQNNRVLLTDASYTSAGQSAQAQHAMLHLRSDGSAERVEADGRVALASPTAGSVYAPQADLLLSAASRAESLHLFGNGNGSGGVRYESLSNVREGRGQAQDARLAFDSAGKPQRLLLTGAVRVEERLRTSPPAPWRTREATASSMTFALATGLAGHTALREAEAAGARLILTTTGPTRATDELAGDTLHVSFTAAGKSALLTGLHASGHTGLRQSAGLAEQTSSGDTLEAELQPTPTARGEEIVRATQAGHVVLTSRPAPKAGALAPPSSTRALADRAVYEHAADHVTLTGHPLVADQGSTLGADRIVLEHATGNATANGSVKASYLSPPPGTSPPRPADPVHILADSATLQHDAGVATFHGGVQPARMWQGSSQIEAPMLEFDQPQRTLTAHGSAGSHDPTPVHAVLAGADKPSPKRSSAVRIASERMVYRDTERQAEFSGAVQLEDADGTVRARQAIAYLAPSGASPSAVAAALPAGKVDRIVATGGVELAQPGRVATGDRLVYTAADELFVLTGTGAAPPRLVDDARGTVTGAELRFHTGDNEVTVLRGDSGTARTETRVRKK